MTKDMMEEEGREERVGDKIGVREGKGHGVSRWSLVTSLLSSIIGVAPRAPPQQPPPPPPNRFSTSTTTSGGADRES